ncbi:MAG: DUF1501 domain-containing protein, partial [Planctomycetaceae bacterium]|nr:DUF1501 domain-containing protein [Planctomycetaceae bacterium]
MSLHHPKSCEHGAVAGENVRTRRQALREIGGGLGAVALAALLQDDLQAEAGIHHAPKARRVIQIFCPGGMSHVDTFDYKPELERLHGQPIPGADKLITFQGEQGSLQKSPWAFKPRGQSGKMVSDLVPRLGDLSDDFCFIHSLHGKTNTHGPGENLMCTGYTLDGFPSMGAWVTYALGSMSEEL